MHGTALSCGLRASSKKVKKRLEAVVEAMGGYIEKKLFFLMEKYHTLLEIKGFSHDFNNSLTIASVCRTDT